MFRIRRSPSFNWIVRLWHRIPEPRHMNLVMGIIYAGYGLGGGLILFMKYPLLGTGEYNPLILLMAILLVIGSIVGIIGGTMEFWQLERVGISGMALAFLIYIAQIFASGDIRVAQLTVVIFGALGTLALRLVRIWRYDFKPRE